MVTRAPLILHTPLFSLLGLHQKCSQSTKIAKISRGGMPPEGWWYINLTTCIFKATYLAIHGTQGILYLHDGDQLIPEKMVGMYNAVLHCIF